MSNQLDLMLDGNLKTMTSTQLAEMLGMEKKEIHRELQHNFQDEIDGGIISPSLDSRGYVAEYHLPELESKMYVAGKDKDYLRVITQYWIDQQQTLSPMEMVIQSARSIIRLEQVQKQLIVDVEAIKNKQELQNGDTGYMTVVAYCRYHSIDTPLTVANKWGRQCAKLSKKLNIKIGKIPGERWGQVNSYHVSVLDEIIYD